MKPLIDYTVSENSCTKCEISGWKTSELRNRPSKTAMKAYYMVYFMPYNCRWQHPRFVKQLMAAVKAFLNRSKMLCGENPISARPQWLWSNSHLLRIRNGTNTKVTIPGELMPLSMLPTDSPSED